MATKQFTTKLEAILAKAGDGTSAFKLGDEQKEQLLVMLNDFSYIDMCREDLPVASVHAPGQGSITVLKAPNGSLSDKTVLGGKAPSNTAIDNISINWSKPREAKVGLTAYDLGRGLPTALSSVLAKNGEAGRNEREISGFTKLAGEVPKVAGNTLNAATLGDGDVLRTRILTEATSLINTKDDKQGIDFIPQEKIVIFINPETAVKLEKIIGSFAKEQFLLGTLKIAEFGGYKFVVNPFLDRVPSKPKVIITTSFSYASFLNIIYAGVATLPNSADQVAGYEQAIAEGLVYDKVTKVLY